MIEKFVNYINDKSKNYVIFDVGSRDCQQSIEFYKTFPNAKIYVFECNPNTLDLCEKNIIPYQDRITLIKGTSCNYDGNIDICYINDNDYKFIENKIPLNRVKLLLNNEKVLFNYFKKQVILVSTGVFQTYIKENINQLLKFDFDIHVIVDSPFLKNLEEYSSSIKIIDTSSILTNFDEKSKLDKHFRDEFWNNASKRLFLVYEYMRRKNIKNVIHLENDVLLYTNMNYNFEEKIYITMDSNIRCIPGIIYIPKYNLFTKLIENYDFTQNDMINVANFYSDNKDIVKTFPIIDDSIDKCIYNENFQEFNSIFDGAAIGQYLGGVDPRNIAGDSTGFVNETCEIKYDKYRFKWIKKGKYSFPHIEINSKLIPINNLHIHCKKLANFRIENPVENKYIKIKDAPTKVGTVNSLGITDNLSNMHILTYSNREDKLEYLKESESLFNTKVNYITSPVWEGYITKLKEVKKKIQSFNDNDIIIFIDAFDVLISGNTSEIIEKFKSYNCDILVSAELNCYPSFLKNDLDKIMPKNIKNKYINAGGYMGYVKNIKSLLEWKSIDEIVNICKKGTDQAYIIKYFMENYNKLNIKLETKTWIYQNMHWISWKEIDFRGGRVYNNVLNTYPCFVHFNGGTWQTMEKNNIMPVFIELMIKSKKNSEICNLDKYNQLITKTCYPHPQI